MVLEGVCRAGPCISCPSVLGWSLGGVCRPVSPLLVSGLGIVWLC